MLPKRFEHLVERHIMIFDFGLSVFGFGPQVFVMLWPPVAAAPYAVKITFRYIHMTRGRLDVCLRWF